MYLDVLPKSPRIGGIYRNSHQTNPHAGDEGHDEVDRGRIHKQHAVAGRQRRPALGPVQEGPAQGLRFLIQTPVGDGLGSLAGGFVQVGPDFLRVKQHTFNLHSIVD